MSDAAPTPASAELFSGLPDESTLPFRSLCRFCEENSAQVLAALPWLAAEVAGRDGFEAMLSLVRREGGTRLYVSRDYRGFAAPRPARIGEGTHERLLRQANAAGCVEIPSAWGVFLALRRVAIDSALESGASERSVARAFGVTERSLRGSGRRPLRKPSA